MFTSKFLSSYLLPCFHLWGRKVSFYHLHLLLFRHYTCFAFRRSLHPIYFISAASLYISLILTPSTSGVSSVPILLEHLCLGNIFLSVIMTHNMWLIFFTALTNKQKKNHHSALAGERQADSTSSCLYFLPPFDALKHQSVCRLLTFSTNIWLTFGWRTRLNLSSSRLKTGVHFHLSY